MGHKAYLMLFLGFSFALSISAVPTSRSLNSIKNDPATHDLLVQAMMDMRGDGEMVKMEEGFFKGRMDIETQDYPGTGANNNHDPVTPSRV